MCVIAHLNLSLNKINFTSNVFKVIDLFMLSKGFVVNLLR